MDGRLYLFDLQRRLVLESKLQIGDYYMKVLGFCCGRKNGSTEIMMKELFMAIEEKCGAQCQLVRRPFNGVDYHMAFCGCELY